MTTQTPTFTRRRVAAGNPPAAAASPPSRVARPQNRAETPAAPAAAPLAAPAARKPQGQPIAAPEQKAAPSQLRRPAPAPAAAAAPAPTAPAAAPANAPEAAGGKGLDSIVRKVFEIEVKASDFDRLERELDLRDPTSRVAIDRSLNDAERNALLAHRLKCGAEAEFESLHVESLKALAELRDEATKELQGEKDAGNRSKAITDADVEHRMAKLDAELFMTVSRRDKERERVISHLGHLCDLWKQRARTLAAMKQ